MDSPLPDTDQKLYEYGNKARKDKKELKIQIVAELMLKGIQQAENIHNVLLSSTPPLNIPVRSIARYKSIINKRNELAVKSRGNLAKTVEETALSIKQNFDLVTKEMWQTYHNSKTGASTKATLLTAIRDTCVKSVELLQSLGLVEERPQQMQYLDKDGKPTDVPNVEVMVLDQQFTAFIKANYQLPLGVNEKEEAHA